MDFFSKGYTALRGPQGEPQTALDTIIKLTDRLTQSTLISDRRAAVLGLKGLSRDCKADVGQYALESLLSLLDTDAKDDADTGKVILETLLVLCKVDAREGAKIPRDDLGLRHTDIALTVNLNYAIVTRIIDLALIDPYCRPPSQYSPSSAFCKTLISTSG